MSFQGYAIDSEGKALGSESINVKLSLYPEGGNIEYTETHTTFTDAYGVFAEQIGSITPVDFKKLNFINTNYKLKVEVKKTSEGVYTTVSDAELLAVPYARCAANGVPVGAILPFGGSLSNVPDGWLPCNGSSVLISNYPQLYAAIGNAWGHSGTHFNLPDLRGLFLRGVDHGRGQDPDRGGRGHMKSGGNSGDNVGSYQSYTYQSHSHGASATQEHHRHSYTDTYYRENDDKLTQQNVDGSHSTDADNEDWNKTRNTDYQTPSISVTVTHSGGNETRPRNANVEFIIKY